MSRKFLVLLAALTSLAAAVMSTGASASSKGCLAILSYGGQPAFPLKLELKGLPPTGVITGNVNYPKAQLVLTNTGTKTYPSVRVTLGPTSYMVGQSHPAYITTHQPPTIVSAVWKLGVLRPHATVTVARMTMRFPATNGGLPGLAVPVTARASGAYSGTYLSLCFKKGAV